MNEPRNLTFRRGTAANREHFKALGLLAYGQYIPELTPDNWELMRKSLESTDTWDVLVTDGIPFVCVDGEQVVGMAFLFPGGNPSEIYPADWSYIRMIGVHPEYEGCGIARTLTSQCIEYARETGEHTIALHTSELMHAARHIYEKLGFRINRELGLRYGIMYWLFVQALRTDE